MLNLSFAGTLGRDAETRDAGSSQVTEFSVAVNGYDRKERQKTTTWLKVTIWGKRGEQLANLVAKGDKVAGSGLFEVQTYTTSGGEKRTSFVVTAQDLTLQGRSGGGEQRDEAPPARGRGRAPAKAADFPEDDDLPF